MHITYKRARLQPQTPRYLKPQQTDATLPNEILGLIASYTPQPIRCLFRATNTHMRDQMTPLMHVYLQRWCMGGGDFPRALVQRASSCTVLYSPWFLFDYSKLDQIPPSCKISLISSNVMLPKGLPQVCSDNFSTALTSCANIGCCTIYTWLPFSHYTSLAECAQVHTLKLYNHHGILDNDVFMVCQSTTLRSLYIKDCPTLTNLSLVCLAACTTLEHVNMDGCKNINALGILLLSGSTSLQHISLRYCHQLGVRALLPLLSIPTLRRLDVFGCLLPSQVTQLLQLAVNNQHDVVVSCRFS